MSGGQLSEGQLSGGQLSRYLWIVSMNSSNTRYWSSEVPLLLGSCVLLDLSQVSSYFSPVESEELSQFLCEAVDLGPSP